MEIVVVSVIRKGAFKRLSFSTSQEHVLAILQIFETTDDVVDYQVAKIGKNFIPEDMYLPNSKGFDKWKPATTLSGQ